MASPFDNRAVTPIMTSLSQSCLTKVAVTLWQEFGSWRLNQAFDFIQCGGMLLPYFFRAYQCLLLIPALFRKKLIAAVYSLDHEVGDWKQEHEGMIKLKDGDHVFYWRPDGTIDRMKTTQRLVLDADICIIARFNVACNYCLVRNIHTLWSEMEIYGYTEHLATYDRMVSFWVRRIREGSDDPWPMAALEYLDYVRFLSYSSCVQTKLACCRSIFPLLQQEDRNRFLDYFPHANPDDLRLCLYMMTKEEQEQVFSRCAWKVLGLHFEPPLRSFFLETAKKMWSCLDESNFYILLNFLLIKSNNPNYTQDSDYSIIEDVWNMSPDNLKRRARNDSSTWAKINSFLLKETRKKRKAEDEMNEQIRKRIR